MDTPAHTTTNEPRFSVGPKLLEAGAANPFRRPPFGVMLGKLWQWIGGVHMNNVRPR